MPKKPTRNWVWQASMEPDGERPKPDIAAGAAAILLWAVVLLPLGYAIFQAVARS